MKVYLKYNLKLMFKQKTFHLIFVGMLLLCMGLPFFHVLKNWGQYEYALPSADTLYIANGDSEWWGYFSLIIPFLIVLPYGFSFMNDYKHGTYIYVQTRGKRKFYYYSQMLTCFIGTFIVISIPFIFNIALNGILFPLNGNDAVMLNQKYDYNWCMRIMGEGFYIDTLSHGALWKHLAIDFPQINNLIYALWDGFAIGIMSAFFYGLSLLIKRGSIWVLLISYLFFQMFRVFNRFWEEKTFFGVYINLNLTDYLASGYPEYGLVYPLYLFLLLILCMVPFGIIHYRIKNDER